MCTCKPFQFTTFPDGLCSHCRRRFVDPDSSLCASCLAQIPF